MQLLGKAMSPAFWEEVRTKECYRKYREELFDLWEKKCSSAEIPALTYSAFRLFKYTGDRSVYESGYFRRRLAMDTAALLALIYPEEEKYTVRLMDEIFAVCDEYTWCLPAHQPVLEVNNNCFIDLFASETAFALSEIDTLLGDRLEPLIRDRIRTEIHRRVIDPYRESRETYGWTRSTNNWAAVCMGSVGCTVMLMCPDLFEELKPRFDETVEGYLRGFGEDGICVEGFGYWHYGFGFFTVYADMLRTFTGGKCDYFQNPKVREIAAFVQKAYLDRHVTVSFSDGSPTGRFQIGLNHYLHSVYPDYVKILDPDCSYSYDSCGRFCLHLRAFTWFSEDAKPEPVECETYFAPASEWMIRKTAAYGFAAKGGHNGESHNHNDIGSFIFVKGDRQLLCDLGSGPYTRQYFAPATRYTQYLCNSSRGHNLPIIDGALQKEGKNFRAADTAYENGVFSLDIAPAYERESIGLCRLVRSFALGAGDVRLTDRFSFCDGREHGITERFVTLLTPSVDEASGRITVGDGTFTYDPAAVTSVRVTQEEHTSGVHPYLVVILLKPGTDTFTLRME